MKLLDSERELIDDLGKVLYKASICPYSADQDHASGAIATALFQVVRDAYTRRHCSYDMTYIRKRFDARWNGRNAAEVVQLAIDELNGTAAAL